ncbi:protein FATTY ACID EXPORT 1, chloroplastic [Benincasa hispida]|uniref:protein FATTY ACID EXPORT 1, chloroplastic n=1 Tax=Benincasa hispida TaxID=102211 RepID=UPI0019005C38|nr:protein FATTY ACID EXPORT 1, chloroplastic [Benincasa hispida]
MAATASQFSCLSAINRGFRLQHRRSFLAPRSSLFFPKYSIVMNLEGSASNTTDSQTETTLSYATDASESQVVTNSYPGVEESSDVGNLENEKLQEPDDVGTVPKRTAKIHDFCFGIPFGGIVLSGGLISFIFSRNPSALSSLISGGALLALSTLSLKIWRQGKSSLPFILGQAVFTASFFWNSFQTYSLTKNVFPAAFYAALSAAMLCFYLYVVISGGNPPPKKLKPSPSAA